MTSALPMQKAAESKLKSLSKAVVLHRTEVRQARERLIEGLGDWMCTSAAPATPEDLERFAALQQAEVDARARFARCVIALSRAVVARVQRPSARK